MEPNSNVASCAVTDLRCNLHRITSQDPIRAKLTTGPNLQSIEYNKIVDDKIIKITDALVPQSFPILVTRSDV